MGASDLTPVAVAFVSAVGAVCAAYIAYKGGQKNKQKIDNLPNSLVQEFAHLNPGVDTVEKVIELLYAEIGRLNANNQALEQKVTSLVNEKQELLDEITTLKNSLSDHQRQLDFLEAKIKHSIEQS